MLLVFFILRFHCKIKGANETITPCDIIVLVSLKFPLKHRIQKRTYNTALFKHHFASLMFLLT